MSEFSTKISDLPDNTSSRILNDLKNDEEISIISESEDQDQEPEQQVEQFDTLKKKKTKKSKILSEKNLKIIYDSVIVFVLTFITNTEQSHLLLSKIPYLASYLSDNGFISNIIIAIIVALMYIIIKVSLDYYYSNKK